MSATASNFSLGVSVLAVVGSADIVSRQITSELLSEARGLYVELTFPYRTAEFSGNGADLLRPNDHRSS